MKNIRIQGVKGSRFQVKGMGYKTLEPWNTGTLESLNPFFVILEK